jgi:hypothetical protein
MGQARHRRAYLVLVLASAALICGCGRSSGPPMYDVSGMVTWEGQPLEEGDVIFAPNEAAVEPVAGTIRGGAYQIRARPGKHKVSIRASKLVPNSKGAMGEPIHDNFIPDRYNVKTALEADVTPEGENRFDFALSKK